MKKEKWFSKLLYVFLLVSPFLDALSFLFREWFPDAPISPSTILRPIIPLILVIAIFITDRKERKPLFIAGALYGVYAILHMIGYQQLITGSSYGSFFHEAQYLINYTYMMVLFFIIQYEIKQHRLEKVSYYVLWSMAFYLGILFLAIVTKTSYPTYIDGLGERGWFASGNALGSILLLSFTFVLPFIMKEHKKSMFLLVMVLGIYLMFFLGTKTGLLGFPLILLVYVIGRLLYHFIYRTKKLSGKELIIISMVVVVSLGGVGFFGSATLDRQKHLKEEGDQVENGEEISHVTGDALRFVEQIKKGEITEDYMSKAQQNALVSMYETANIWKIQNSNRRIQQVLYHTYLVKEQKNPFALLVGNGYLTNYPEMTLEMEVPAFLYNFGLLGFVLFLGPFLYIEGVAIYRFFRYLKKTDIEYFIYLFGSVFSLVLSLLAGYTFFNVSSMLFVILLHSFLWKKAKEAQL